MKKIIKNSLIFIGLLILYVVLLTITAIIPKSAILHNIEDSIDELVDGEFPIYRELFTDSIMFDFCYKSDESQPLESALKNITISNYEDGVDPYYGYDGQEAFWSEFEEVLDEDGNDKYVYDYSYARYWHGYLIFLRPLLVFFNYNQIVIVCGILFLIALIYLEILIFKKFGIKMAILTLLVLFSMGYFTLWLSISLVPTILIMMIASIIVVQRKDKIKDIYWYFFIVGSLTSYFCWINFTLLTLGFPLVFYYLQHKDYSIKHFIKILIVYNLGFFVTMVSKWIIVDLICGTSIIKDGINQVLFRVSYVDSFHEDINFLDVIQQNIKYYFEAIVIAYIYLYVKVLIVCIKKMKLNLKITKEKVIFILISLIPIVAYFLTINYSHIHAPTYTHRMLGLTLICIVIVFEKTIDKKFFKTLDNEEKK